MASSLVSAYASVMMIQSMANNIIPHPVRSFLDSASRYLFSSFSTDITFVIEEASGLAQNQVFEAVETYLRTRMISTTHHSIRRFKVDKTERQKSLTIRIDKNQEIFDTYQNHKFKWKLLEYKEDKLGSDLPHMALMMGHGRNRYFELSFHEKLKERVIHEYLPFILETFKEIQGEDKVVKLYTRRIGGMGCVDGNVGSKLWCSINLEHPATFDTLAMQPETKTALLEDLERFVSRKKFYKQVGKAWKRGYLLYGPPGTGKSSLIAAMANHLKFDIYDLELTSLYSNSELRSILVSTTNRSILVIEDIDGSLEMQDSGNGHFSGYQQEASTTKLTLSGLLNFIDGLWSSCGDERIIVFTTNHKDRLDPALLRPGRMDMHIHMSYCTKVGFRQLAYNYLGIPPVDHHHTTTNYNQLFGAIEDLIEDLEVTPAELAEELMKSQDAEIALEGVVDFLELKRLACNC